MSVACPEVEQLQQLVRGEMAPDASDRYFDHVEQCPLCADSIEGLLAADPFVAAVRGQPAQPTSYPPPVIELIHRLSTLRAAPTVVADGATPTPEGESSDDCTALFAPAEALDEIGRLGGYRILKILGAGGMACVYLAEDLVLRRQVALKVMRPTLADRAAARKRFLREARAVAAVEHENIVTIHQVGEERGVAFLAMPLLKGGTLEAKLRGGAPLPLAEVLRWGQQIAVGLSAAHERRLVHRDVKPSNIWIEPADGGRVKLLDFGLACELLPRRTATGDGPITELGTLIGTPAYLAPEQARGLPVDGRADLFSLGCVLYRMATGRLPFDGDDPVSVIVAITTKQPQPPASVNPKVPLALSELIMQLLEKDPIRRPSSAAAVARRLAHLEKTKSAAPRFPWLLVLGAAAALLVLGILVAEIIVRIKDKDGKTVGEYKVPDGGSVEMVDSGKKQQGQADQDSKAVEISDPTELTSKHWEPGTVLTCRVRGTTSGSVWGSGPYSIDSDLATTAVHAGILKLRQRRVVTIKIVKSPTSFRGSAANGVTTMDYEEWPAGAFIFLSGKTATFTDPEQVSSGTWKAGTILTVRVKGDTSGSVWGSGPYTLDSSLGTAAVHAGLLKSGQVGIVTVEVIKSPAAYRGSTANGVTTQDFGRYDPGAFVFLSSKPVKSGEPITIDDPEQLNTGQWEPGTVITCKVTGSRSWSVWGSGPYSIDSNLAVAAVHAGLLKDGETGTVTLKVVRSRRPSRARRPTASPRSVTAPGMPERSSSSRATKAKDR